MFCDELARWIPVQISWIRGLSTEYYYIHFAILFRQFLKAQITPLERDDLVLQVVDFLKAQTEGFISAYIDVFRHGTREEELFRQACMDLLELEEPSGPTHEQKVDHIRPRWPKVKKWLNWWTTADVEAQLFQSRRPRVEDSPETAYDRLPETTNAQESMHRLYYMISDGKQCLLVGMVELFAFVTSLEYNWKSVMNGVPINYGSQKTQDVGLTMGLETRTRQKNLSDLPNAASFDKNQFLTYVSYRRNTSNALLANRSKWRTVPMNCILDDSKPGDHASADFFLEISLDPKLHKSPWYQDLFLVKERRTFTCEAFPDGLQLHPLRANRTFHVLSITPQMFSDNRIPYSDVKQLLDDWQHSGLRGISGLVCKQCTIPQPLTEPKKKSKLKRVDSSIDLVLDFSQPASAHYIIDRRVLTFEESGPPLHLYFHLNLATLAKQLEQRADFMGHTDWPFKVSLGGSTYTLISRGYWSGVHYWCKVLRSSAGLTGVWLHDKMVNNGYARLINRVPSAIAGPSPQTSWLMYSRVWTSSEEKVVDKAIDKIRLDVTNPVGVVPFTDLKGHCEHVPQLDYHFSQRYHRIFASIAPAQIPSKSEPSPDDDLEIEDVNFQKFEFLDHDLAKLEAQIETATKQLCQRAVFFHTPDQRNGVRATQANQESEDC
ncbi:hypothetical protein PSHT_04648 [Puccinia striiformis]|uniref:Uncharacterized protein n=1 Tax=Puccinia striiformis TaxID=27350 RepID=A0A2S4WCC4_9BASI|nr:hypothetical protein PSHT_04648 [Puccinia striiformis]